MVVSHNSSIFSLLTASKEVSQICQPVFFRLSNIADQKNIESLLKNRPFIQVFDQIHGQVQELIKIQNPSTTYRGKELWVAADAFLKDKDAYTYGLWVYYPWSERLVHLLDEEDFVAVRTNRNMYKITRDEREQLAKKKVGIVGLSVGQSVALTMASERIFGEIRLADFDVLELSNMNRIRTGVHNLNVSKTVLAAREMLEIDPFLNIRIFDEGITEDNIEKFFLNNGPLDLLVEECDEIYFKILLRQMAKKNGIPVVMDTSDRGMIDIERFDLEPERSIFHGFLDPFNINQIRDAKTREERISYVLSIIGPEMVSKRLKISMQEIGKSITTWPQLASSVTLGAGIVTDVVRRIFLGELIKSGRFYVDLEEMIKS